MTIHEILLRLAVEFVGVLSAGFALFALLDGADFSTIGPYAGSTVLIGYIALRVWQDSRAIDALRANLEDQLDVMTEDRNLWRDRAQALSDENRELAITLAKLERDTPPAGIG